LRLCNFHLFIFLVLQIYHICWKLHTFWDTTQPAKPVASEVAKPVHTDVKAKLEKIEAGDIVYHMKFGKGKVVKINKNEKFIYVKFMLGEKKFMFPNAFLMGFLVMV